MHNEAAETRSKPSVNDSAIALNTAETTISTPPTPEFSKSGNLPHHPIHLLAAKGLFKGGDPPRTCDTATPHA